MSVTFSIEGNFTGSFTMSAACAQEGTDPFKGQVFGDYQTAETALVAHRAACEDCAHYGCYTSAVLDVPDDFDVNLANQNARLVGAVLGIDLDEDLCGSMDAEVFLGHAVTALAVTGTDLGVDDSGIDAVEDTVPGRTTVIHCGLRAGYYTETITRLHDLAAEAARLGRPVVWS